MTTQPTRGATLFGDAGAARPTRGATNHATQGATQGARR